MFEFNFFEDESIEDSIARLAEYYANGEMSEKDFKKAMKQIKRSNFNAVVDECNSHRLSRQTLISQEEMRQDRRATGYAPIGYQNVILENREADVVPDTNNATFVRELFQLFSTGVYSIGHLVEVAKRFGLVGKKSKKPLTKQAIVYILNNPFYCGFARHKGNWYKHKYKPIIPIDLFAMCQKILIERGIIK